MKGRLAAIFHGLVVFLLQMCVDGISPLWPLLQHHKILTGKGAHLRDLEEFLEKPAKGGLGIPVGEGHWPLVVWVSVAELTQDLLRSQPLALIEI